MFFASYPKKKLRYFGMWYLCFPVFLIRTNGFGVMPFGILAFGILDFGFLGFGILDFGNLDFGVLDSVFWAVTVET